MKMQLDNGIKKKFNLKHLSDLLICDRTIGLSCQTVKPMCSTDVCLLRKTVTISWIKKRLFSHPTVIKFIVCPDDFFFYLQTSMTRMG